MGKHIINWLRGASSVIDIWPDTESKMRALFLERSDADALRNDWYNVGNDIKRATESYEQEQKAAP